MSVIANQYFVDAKKQFRLGNSTGGYESLNKAISLDINNIEYLNERALRYYDNQSYQNAIDDLLTIINHAKNIDEIAHAHIRKYLCYEALGQYNNALEDIEWVIENTSADTTTYATHGHYMLRFEKFKEAVKDFTVAHELDPKDITILLRRATTYYLLKDYINAIADLTSIIPIAVNLNLLSAIYHWRGSSFYMIGKNQEALDDFNEIMKIHNRPLYNNPSIYFNQTHPNV